MRQMAKEGKGTFYRGFGLKLLRAVPGSAVSFYVYESAKRLLNDHDFDWHRKKVAGGNAAAIAG